MIHQQFNPHEYICTCTVELPPHSYLLPLTTHHSNSKMEDATKKKNIYSSGEMEALTAICDTFIGVVDDTDQFYATSASMAGTPHHVAVLLGEKLRHPKIYLSKLSLWMLSSWIGTFILCGHKSLSSEFPYFRRFANVPVEKRVQVLKSWSESKFLLLRILYTAFKIFIHLMFFTQVNEKDDNITWKAIGYQRPARNIGKVPEKEEDDEKFGPLHRGIVDLNQSKETSTNKLQDLGFDVSIPCSKTTNASFIIKCDAVVIGSGSGGGIVAGVLAKAGYKVVMLEKGKYFPKSRLSLLEGRSIDEMYLGHGILATENMDVLILAGSTVGGGSRINWSASIRTPNHVRKDWSENYGLKLFGSEVYDKALDVVCKRMGVQSEIDQEGFNNMVLRRGCKNLGFPVETIPRNAPPDHYCGACCLGCKDGRKKDVCETWLADMVESGNGVILPECEAVEVITHGKRAVGVAFMFGENREIAVVEADATVVSCGAICTPPLLKRSGLKNANIGRNLHLHPVVMAWGYFPESSWPEPEMRSFEGGIMTAMSTVAEPSGYGAVIQTPALHPGMFSALMPWLSGVDMRDRMQKFSRTATVFTLARDKGSGAVKTATDISYKLEKSDQENLSRGMEKVLRILAAAGAEEIGTQHREGRVLRVKEAEAEEVERFVKEESWRAWRNLSSPICSAHQMGSCRMGVDGKGSAVRPTGETWEVRGLYVADASVFPTALGVNPMVTVQAIAYCIAHSVVAALDTTTKKKKRSVE